MEYYWQIPIFIYTHSINSWLQHFLNRGPTHNTVFHCILKFFNMRSNVHGVEMCVQ